MSARQVDEAPGKSQRACEIKLADKIANVRDIAVSPPKDWPRAQRREYVQWARRVVDGLRGADPALESTFDQIADDVEQQLV